MKQIQEVQLWLQTIFVILSEIEVQVLSAAYCVAGRFE